MRNNFRGSEIIHHRSPLRLSITAIAITTTSIRPPPTETLPRYRTFSTRRAPFRPDSNPTISPPNTTNTQDGSHTRPLPLGYPQ
jgi:hypothetical protein